MTLTFIRPALVAAAFALGGCSGNEPAPVPRDSTVADPGALHFLPPTDVKADCTGCYEPAVAVDPQGRIYVAAHRIGGVAVSEDGGRSFVVRPVPDPEGPTRIGGGPGDDIVNVAPWGTVYYTELWSDLGGSALAGIHLAATDDGGAMWHSNQLIHVRTQPTSLSLNADRQWLAFEGDSTVYLLFNCGQSVLICMLRSDDRGQTFGPARSVVLPLAHSFPSPIGAASLGPDGSLIAPYYALPQVAPFGGRTIAVAASDDGGLSFRQSIVYTHPRGEGTAGGGWPGSTILPDGTWVVGWGTSDDRLWLAASRDAGKTWTAPTILDSQTSGGAGSPWLEPRADGGVDAVWFTYDDQPGVRLGRFSAELELLEMATVPEVGGGQSDYPYFARLPDGRVATAYLTPEGRLRFAVSSR